MTVRELIRKLKEFDEDLPVRMAYPSGDYWRTTIAGSILGVESCKVEWSEYHSKFTVPEEGKDPENGEETVVLL